MTEKAPFDFDVAMAALEMDERVARPAVTGGLQARVLGDAGEIAAKRAVAPVAPAPRKSVQSVGFRFFGLFDAWSGAAAAVLALCLGIGIGVGYGAGPEFMARTGLGDVEIADAAEESGELFLSEDVL